MRMVSAVFLFVVALASCSQTAPTAPAAPAATATPFTIGSLLETDTDITGCTVVLSAANAPQAYAFIEDGLETGAAGFIRIDGAIVRLALVSDATTETGGVRTFASADGATRVVETYTRGEAHEESDSVGRTADLAVAHRGATQTLHVQGGAVC